MKEEINLFNSFGRNTLQEKVYWSKSKLLPIFSYIANVHPVPDSISNQIDKLLLEFIVPHKQCNRSIFNFTASKADGGYGFDHISLHASLFLLRPVISYIKYLATGEPISHDDKASIN